MRYRRPDLDIRPSFIQQLAAYEVLLAKCGLGPKTNTWNGIFIGLTILRIEVYEGNIAYENEELLLRNTYVNAHLDKFTESHALLASHKGKKSRKLQWVDGATDSNVSAAPAMDKVTCMLATFIVNADENAEISAKPIFEGKLEAKPILRKDHPCDLKKNQAKIVPSREKSIKVPMIKCKELEVQAKNKEAEKGNVNDFLNELDQIPAQKVSSTASKPITVTSSHSNPLKENNNTPIIHHKSKNDQNSKLVSTAKISNPIPFAEESNVQKKILVSSMKPVHPPEYAPRKIETKPLKTQQRSSSASVKREVASSPKPTIRSKDTDSQYTSKRETPKNQNKEKSVPLREIRHDAKRPGEVQNRNSSSLAFYSFKQAPVSIGGENYLRTCGTSVLSKINAGFGTAGGPIKAASSKNVIPKKPIAHNPVPDPTAQMKIVKPHRNARTRPASPGVKGKSIFLLKK